MKIRKCKCCGKTGDKFMHYCCAESTYEINDWEDE